MSGPDKLWWVSWYQPTDDYRPLTYPPTTKAILGWWCSGYACGEDRDTPILCAAVVAESETQVKRRVHKEWPEAKDWRFIEERSPDWQPGDRFPLEYWMKPRFAAISKAEGDAR